MVKDMLIAYSQGRVKGEAVVRSLIRHRGWLVPAIWLVTWRSHPTNPDISSAVLMPLWNPEIDTGFRVRSCGGQLSAPRHLLSP